MGGYPASPYGWVPPPPRRNQLGITSLVCGICAAVLFWLPLVNLALAITAVATGVAARRRIKRGEADNNGATITGVVLGILAGVASLVAIVIVAGIVALEIDQQNCIDHAQGRGELAQCH